MSAQKESLIFSRRAFVVGAAGTLVTGLLTRAHAQGLTSYDVELVIFRALTPPRTEEDWSIEARSLQNTLILSSETQAESATPVTAEATRFPSLPAERMKLTAIADTLRRHRNYRTLAHVGWTQPGFSRNAAQPISLDGLVPPDAQLSGKAALARGRYLHLSLDLIYRPQDAPITEPLILRQSRRMRSGERHYFDHPYLGVISLVTPTQS